jgi:cation diffusion facilitator CzcD-associated flavoprotein CzcO
MNDVTHIDAGTGCLDAAAYPNMPGIETFAGRLIHLGAGGHGIDHDVRGQRVGVIGSGAGAVQILPELLKVAAHVKVFQRTPPWVLPTERLPLPPWAERVALAWLSPQGLMRWQQSRARAHLRREVKEPWLHRQLTPHPEAPCERVLISGGYYAALQQPHCKLLTWPIDRIAPGGVRTVEGVEHQLDCIVIGN